VKRDREKAPQHSKHSTGLLVTSTLTEHLELQDIAAHAILSEVFLFCLFWFGFGPMY
jgi:hypothetical protein